MYFTKFNNFSGTFVFDSKIPGPTVAVFGGIHGNETAGVQVINHLLSELENNTLEIKKGRLILAYGNEKAIEINQREYKYNLNRLFRDECLYSSSDEYEIKRAQELKQILDASDILLDLHSVSSKSEAFMFVENIAHEIEIARAICDKNIIVGWGEIGGDLLSGDTDGYMHSIEKPAFTFECGNHLDASAFETGLNTTKKLLKYMELTDKKEITSTKETLKNIFEMYEIVTTKTGNFRFENGIKNFDMIQKGETIGYDGDKKVIAKEDFYILLPNFAKTKVGEDIFYYGRNIA